MGTVLIASLMFNAGGRERPRRCGLLVTLVKAGDEAAMKEFVCIRRKLPDGLRTQYINALHHGGTKNEY
jgi:hypothetical protein